MRRDKFSLNLSSTAKLRIWTLRIWVFWGPEFHPARQVLCGDASRLFLDHFSEHLSSALGLTELCHEVRNPGPQKPEIIRNENHHLALFDFSWYRDFSRIFVRIFPEIFKFLRILFVHCFCFPGNRDHKKFNKNPRHFSTKSPGKYEENIHIIFLESRQSNF